MKNIFENLTSSATHELVQDVFRGQKFRIERIISWAHTTDWQEQSEDEWVLVMDGSARLEFAGNAGLEVVREFLTERENGEICAPSCDKSNKNLSKILENQDQKSKNLQAFGKISSLHALDENVSQTLEISLKRGEHVFIPAGTKHRVSYTSKPCYWLCVFA